MGNLFLDCEFLERGHHFPVDLISLALVSEDGREFYRISNEFDLTAVERSAWLRENVLPKLDYEIDDEGRVRQEVLAYTNNIRGIPRARSQHLHVSRKQMRDDLDDFLRDDLKPVFWGNFCDYDWVVLCQLYGAMIQLPKKFPRWCRDLKQEATRLGMPRALMPKQDESSSHDALADARWNLQAFQALRDYEKRRNIPGPSLLK